MNLVLIVSDTLRWDYIGAYGNDRIHTPNLDRLAAESAVFEDAYAEGLPTIPARRVLLTGRPIFPFKYIPQKSDMVQLPGWHPLFEEDVSLPEVLRDQDYVCAFVTDVYHLMKPNKNFHRGFEHWYWVRGQEDDPFALRDERQVRDMLQQAAPQADRFRERHWLIQHLMNRKDWQSDADTSVARVMSHAAAWIEQYSMDNPFCLYVDCFDPHEPWDPPLEDAKLYDPQYEGLDGLVPGGTTANMTDDQVRRVEAAYAGEVTLVDRWVGKLLDTLRDRGLIEETLVIFTTDHGCMMGEQGEIHKGEDRLRNQCTRLPLFIRHPQGTGAGQRVRGFVQHQDIMPTALGLLGVEAPERALGSDVWPMVAAGADAPRDTIVTSFGHHASVRTAKWNYIRPWTELPPDRRSRHELYDLQADPEELTTVLADHKDVAGELDEYLRAHINEYAPLTRGTVGAGVVEGVETRPGMSFDALPSLEAE
jgi:arylsulfatase A-like enzyme